MLEDVEAQYLLTGAVGPRPRQHIEVVGYLDVRRVLLPVVMHVSRTRRCPTAQLQLHRFPLRPRLAPDFGQARFWSGARTPLSFPPWRAQVPDRWEKGCPGPARAQVQRAGPFFLAWPRLEAEPTPSEGVPL